MKEKLKAMWRLWKSEEYFLTVANQKNPYGDRNFGPIEYEYMTNTNRDLFYIFIKDHIKNYYNKIMEDK